MKLDQSHPLNEIIIKHLKSDAVAIAPPDSHPNPYSELGCHPDTVEYVWDHLGAALTMDCRAIIYGYPALVHPDAGVILAMSYGTAYSTLR